MVVSADFQAALSTRVYAAIRPVALDGCSVDNEAVVPLGKIARVEVTIDAVPGRMNET